MVAGKKKVTKKPVSHSSQSGKKSIKELHKELGFVAPPSLDDRIRNNLDLDEELWQELKEYELVPRWINLDKYRKVGYNKSDWVPYKRMSRPRNNAIYSVDSDGYTVYQDLILAVKPEEHQEVHRQKLKIKARRMSNAKAAFAEELRRSTKQAGLNSKVIEGYDENA